MTEGQAPGNRKGGTFNLSFPERWRSTLPWALFFLAVGTWLVLNLQWGRMVAMDEFEFLRATDWVRQGRVPYRDFWEHHAPLQWYLMAPLEALGHGPGTGPALWLRWCQVPLWAAGLWGLHRLMGRMDLKGWPRLAAWACLLSSPFFVFKALEYRVDTLASVLLLLALGCLPMAGRGRRWAWTLGFLLGAAGMANLRIVPVAAFALLLSLVIDMDQERWGLRRHAAWTLLGALSLVALWCLYLSATHSLGIAWQRLILDNALGDQAFPPGSSTFFPTLRVMFEEGDLPALLLLLAGLGGLALACGKLRRPGLPLLLGLLQAANLAFVWRMRVHYIYHFQLAALLMVPLAALLLRKLQGWAWLARTRWPSLLFHGGLAAHLLWSFSNLAAGGQGGDLAYQDRVLRTAAARVPAGERVLDAGGYLLSREPAYEHWFIPLLVRFLSKQGHMRPYPVEAFRQSPPGALIVNGRTANWFMEWPELGRHAFSHYLPTLPNLWLPGLSARLDGRSPSATWVVPVTGDYQVLGSEQLAGHPWFLQPLAFGANGAHIPAQLRIDPQAFASSGLEDLSWQLDGKTVQAKGNRLQLTRGARLQVSLLSRKPLGLLVVPFPLEPRFLPAPGDARFDEDFLAYYRSNP